MALHAILLLAALLRFHKLNEPGLWLDEIYYTLIAQQPLMSQITRPIETVSLRYGNDPILSAVPFTLSLKLGDSNYLARFPAALFGILAIAAIYRLGRSLFGNHVGLMAAFLLATSSFHVLYSQEARSYSQLLFFATVAFWFFYQGLLKPNLSRWLVYSFFTWAGVSSNYTMVFAVSIQAIFLAIISFFPPQKQEIFKTIKIWGYFFLALAIVFVLRLPWQGALMFSIKNNTVGGSASLDLLDNLSQFMNVATMDRFSTALVFLVLCLSGFITGLGNFPKPTILLICWLFLSIPITALSIWLAGHFFHPRFTLWALPAFLMATACGLPALADLSSKIVWLSKSSFISETVAKAARWAITIFFVTPILLPNLNQIRQQPGLKQHWPRGKLQEAASLITSKAHDHEAVIAIGLPASHLQFYIEQKRDDLIYLDENSFITKQIEQKLPPGLKGRWYVIHNAYSPPRIPESWKNRLEYGEFHDLVVVHRSAPCSLEGCIEDIKVLLSEISEANPGSALEKVANNIMAGFVQLGY